MGWKISHDIYRQIVDYFLLRKLNLDSSTLLLNAGPCSGLPTCDVLRYYLQYVECEPSIEHASAGQEGFLCFEVGFFHLRYIFFIIASMRFHRYDYWILPQNNVPRTTLGIHGNGSSRSSDK